MTDDGGWTISQLATEFDVSTRSIRFYEEKGLICPERTPGGYRLYNKRDRARLKLILRGKRFGMTLDEIQDILGLGSVDMDEAEQIRKAITYGQRIMADVQQRMDELKIMHQDLMDIGDKLQARLDELDGRAANEA
ncbi:transcriptional regulator, MerR family [Desulfarculus baarsii DSM 2075]|uniref:Transcriptional regulator, MerR family n=1 Tax=Desulfarculus baarsii (strain ATCC 33931 / DSM 2075 / LMG 7858 / VKM B-1802 / 2st14) TaxID=644282 RepID=E1QM18_DESB2|nr:MerR family DNA-binding transcriptional regulator [Desulfarculus baarsii]ADK86603.1 transcriptional regulator, MerR family [Desulfarculus baarsii DSM 2075]